MADDNNFSIPGGRRGAAAVGARAGAAGGDGARPQPA